MGNIQFDIRNRALITEDDKIKELRQMEFNILRKLIANFDQLVSRDEILYAAWEGQTEYYSDQNLNNYIRWLRNLLDEDNNLGIEVHRGVGYRLKETLPT